MSTWEEALEKMKKVIESRTKSKEELEKAKKEKESQAKK